MNEIICPEDYPPGTTDSFVSSEVIVAALCTAANSSGRVRVLKQQSQKGKPGVALAGTRPNPMINGHQDWLDSLVGAARQATGARQ
ncbi:MAG TPA: hypothetical protein VMJ11_02700 [Paraburkholderia sp.]|uniref:hypothetical protein n=1 Tax=Paraburkholderia sp. TaxID=1926495 RepID=UPI002D1E10C8|nr:hypothetical protein [Paraburkholderia sp.]HTR05573.1 hypothetical protein [Paraburkholderia sp.]